jgi:hypothetical protein
VGSAVGRLVGACKDNCAGTYSCSGLFVGSPVGLFVGLGVGRGVGRGVSLGVGFGVARNVSCGLGALVGDSVGDSVGEPVGSLGGCFVAITVGANVGDTVGAELGGSVGETVGSGDGAATGASVEDIGSSPPARHGRMHATATIAMIEMHRIVFLFCRAPIFSLTQSDGFSSFECKMQALLTPQCSSHFKRHPGMQAESLANCECLLWTCSSCVSLMPTKMSNDYLVELFSGFTSCTISCECFESFCCVVICTLF